MEIQKPIYKKEKYPFENFDKLMKWAIKSLNRLKEKERCRQCGDILEKDYEKERKTCGACITIIAKTE